MLARAFAVTETSDCGSHRSALTDVAPHSVRFEKLAIFGCTSRS